MFITCQKDMDFGEEHNAAMDVRLRKFNFKSLKSPPVAGVWTFLKVHAMDCIVWANSLALTPVDELPRPVAGMVSAEPFDEEEKRRIRNVTIDDSEDEADTELTLSQLESDEEMSEEDHGDSSYVEGWEKSLEDISKLREQQPRHSLKRRQLELIGAGVKKFREECDNRVEVAKTRFLEETKARWIASGMMKEVDADLLESVDGPYHPNIENTREEYFAKKKAEEERQLSEKAGNYYNDDWIIAKEKELRELQRKEEVATDLETKRALVYIIEVAVEALKLRFQRESVPGLKRYVLLERQRKAVQMRWCSPEQAQSICSIWSPLPYPSDAQQDERHEMFESPGQSGENADEDDDDLLFTQVPSWQTSHKEFERTRRVHERSQKGKKRARPDKGQHGKSRKTPTNSITNYFSPSQP